MLQILKLQNIPSHTIIFFNDLEMVIFPQNWLMG